MSDIDSVRVAVRIRPLVKSELDRGCQSIIDKVPNEPQVVFKNNDSYTFNFVYAPEVTQEFIYTDSVQAMIERLFKGYNVTILAYGQTGSGKTHTMGTAFDGNFGTDTGVIPRAMYDIFKQIANMTDHEFSVTCSFMELYQEQLYDLLSNSPRDQSVVDIREDGQKGIIIPGLTEMPVSTAKETTDCLIKGSSGRAVGATAMNAQSSRSHAIFTINIQMMKTGDANSSTSSKFHLVDLAGSERSKKTKATGDRFKEGVKINQGLLALGNVISALGSSQGNGYVGYRDSKLTRLLQDSLGGNSVTLMIACVSPADYNMDETLSTLRYADRARKIKNKPIVNQDPKAAEINRLNALVQKLRLDLLSKGGRGSESALPSQDVENMQKMIDDLKEKNKNLQLQLQVTLHDVAESEMRAVVAEAAHDDLYNKVTEVNQLVIDLHKNFNEETCPNEVVEFAKKFSDICKAVEDITGVLEQNKVELLDHKKSMSNAGSSLNLLEIEGSMATDMQRKIDLYNKKQIDLKKELRELDKQLGLKEALHQQCTANLTKIFTYEDNSEMSEEKLKEYENMIQILEAEKAELTGKLKSMKGNPSAKLAEERRVRLQQLEQQISELRKKNKQQANMIKIREKDSEKINNMNREIRDMKAQKVALVRAMRTESENFQKWKLNREKELMQLKEKDRKRQNEMIRMESMHSKKENVLKRRMAEQTAAYKRLKEQFDRQKAIQAQRKNATSGKIEHKLSWIDQELEVIMSVIEANHSIEQLMEDRAALTARLQEIKDSSTGDANDISSIEDEIQMRNAQINDLQQRIISSDIESKMKAIGEGMQSMPEARAALKHLFNTIVEIRKEYAVKDMKLEDLKISCEIAEEKIAELKNDLEKKEQKYKEEMSSIEKGYEEKVTVLLKELNGCPRTNTGEPIEMTESQKIQQEQLDKMEAMREELEQWKKLYNELETQLKFKKPMNKHLTKVEVVEDEILDSADEEEMNLDDSLTDPDWRGTPLKQRNTNSRGAKRSSDGSVRCSCKGNCASKLCSCRKNSSQCSENCKCTAICINKIKEEKSVEEVNGSMNVSDNIGNETVVLEKHTTPQKSFLSTESLIVDTDTPSYPFSKKKRKPFF